MNLRLRLTPRQERTRFKSELPTIEASIVLQAVTLMLRWLKVRTVLKILHILLQRPKRPKRVESQILAAFVRELSQESWLDVQCLEESILVWYLLKRQGQDVHLRFGTNLVQGQFSAHAWVEEQGAPVTADSFDPRLHFRPIDI